MRPLPQRVLPRYRPRSIPRQPCRGDAVGWDHDDVGRDGSRAGHARLTSQVAPRASARPRPSLCARRETRSRNLQLRRGVRRRAAPVLARRRAPREETVCARQPDRTGHGALCHRPGRLGAGGTCRHPLAVARRPRVHGVRADVAARRHPWYLLEWRTTNPPPARNYVTHWFRVYITRELVPMQPMPKRRARPRAD